MFMDTSHYTAAEKKRIVDFVESPDVDMDVIASLTGNWNINELLHWSIQKKQICFDNGVPEPQFTKEAFICILSQKTEEEKRREFANQMAMLMPPESKNKIMKGVKMSRKQNRGALDNRQLLTIVERIEKLNEDAANIAADIKDIFIEAKSAGFDPKYIRKVIKARKKDPDELSEEFELTKMYMNAAGLQLTFDF